MLTSVCCWLLYVGFLFIKNDRFFFYIVVGYVFIFINGNHCSVHNLQVSMLACYVLFGELNFKCDLNLILYLCSFKNKYID